MKLTTPQKEVIRNKTITPKQKSDFNKMRTYLITISKGFQTTAQLKKSAGKYGLDYEEHLEMAYENMMEQAKEGVKGIKEIK